MIVFYTNLYEERVEQGIECIRRILPAVDRAVVLVDQSVTEESKERIRSLNSKIILKPYIWKDDFVQARNIALDAIREIDPYAWVVCADPDEWFCEEFVKDLRKILEEAEKQKANLLLINSHDITTHPDGRVDETVSNFFKNLIFKLSPEVRYEGVGKERTVHETLVIPNAKTITLPRRYYYEHHKSMVDVWERAFRNVYIAGGGNNVGDTNPRWKPLREICERLGLKSWSEVRDYLRKGNIDKELLEWIIDCRLEYGWDWQNEMQDCFRYYKALHPEELEGYEIPPDLKPAYGSPPEVMAWVEKCYLDVFGRHADDQGKQYYTNLILQGKLKREDLPKVLRDSPEYLEKFGGNEENLRALVPIDVDIRLSERVFVEVMMKSNIWFNEIKPKLDVGKFVLEHVKNREEFLRSFYEGMTVKELFKWMEVEE